MIKKLDLKDRIFVAGSTGMAGSAICQELLNKGYGNKKFGGELLKPNSKELNLLDSEKVSNWFKKNKPSVVILAAAKVGGIFANQSQPASFLLENIKIQTNVIESAWKYGTKRLLFLGSSCIYPKFSKQPIKEEYLLKGELESTNEWYAIAKIAGIKLCESLRIQHNFDAISLMPTNLYGPGDNYHPQNSHVMAALIKKFYDAKKTSSKSVICWGSGSPLREFMHVRDLGSAAVYLLENWDLNNNEAPLDNKNNPISYLNVGTGLDISIKKLAEKIAHFTEFKGEIIWDKTKPDGTPKKQLNIDKIRSLGWEPKIKLDDGIKETINNYIEHFS